MSLDVVGKITIFARWRENSQGASFPTFTTTISREYSDTGKKASKSIQVFFSKKKYDSGYLVEHFQEDTAYTIKVKNGFLGLRTYFNSKGDEVVDLAVNVMDYELLSATAVDKEKREVARTLAEIQKEPPEVPSPMESEAIDIVDDDLPF